MAADSTVALTPPHHRPRKRIGIAATALVCFAGGVGASLLAIDRPTRVQVETFAQPGNVAIPPSPPITVIVAPPVAPAAVPPTPPPIRATTPFLDAECVAFLAPEADPPQTSPSCDWSDGFPAVSNDGTLVVTKVHPDDGGRDYPGLTVRFIDVKTSKAVRDILVLDPDEIDPAYNGSTDDAAYAPLLAKHRTTLMAKIQRRVRVAQTLIDTKGYRSMNELPSTEPGRVETEGDVYAEVAMHDNNTASVRAIDPSTSTALWSHTFGEPRMAPPRKVVGDGECGGYSLAEMTFAWDPQTRIVLASSLWSTGGCLCGADFVEEVVTL